MVCGLPPRALHAIVLERRNVSAEYSSWRRAVDRRNWGTNPARQEERASSQAHGPRDRSAAAAAAASAAAAAAGAEPPGRAVYERDRGLEAFAAEHREWYGALRAAASIVDRRTLLTSS